MFEKDFALSELTIKLYKLLSSDTNLKISYELVFERDLPYRQLLKMIFLIYINSYTHFKS